MSAATLQLKPIDGEALAWLRREGGGMLISRVPDKTETDVFGFRTPGVPTFTRLIKMGLVFLTEEDAMFPDAPEMGTWTPSYQLTDAGEIQAAQAA